MERNSRANMYITNAFYQEDNEKLQSCATAHQKWKALEEMYVGSSDLRKLDRFREKCDLYNFKMEKNESVSGYQARFEVITCALHAHGITLTKIPKEERIRIIVDGLPRPHKMTKAIFNETCKTDDLSFHEVFGKIEKYDKEDREGRSGTSKGMALMIEKVVALLENDEE